MALIFSSTLLCRVYLWDGAGAAAATVTSQPTAVKSSGIYYTI